ncbi:hypothetical protein EVAR_36396_1 [Eumeta japonica]|uniref:Uncharacterized protein n=1 Tax=Eumeta variegata TaxID=151549 RepID=A0A4C1W5W8_EUMVA|nr:hypothetical protein EVAR_36396_1 [Eumeta japonica]
MGKIGSGLVRGARPQHDAGTHAARRRSGPGTRLGQYRVGSSAGRLLLCLISCRRIRSAVGKFSYFISLLTANDYYESSYVFLVTFHGVVPHLRSTFAPFLDVRRVTLFLCKAHRRLRYLLPQAGKCCPVSEFIFDRARDLGADMEMISFAFLDNGV